MKKLTIFALASVAAIPLAGAANANECKQVASVGSGVTKGIAETMANGGLKNIIDNYGMVGTGPIKMKCVDGTFVTECTAQQKACK